MDTDGTNMFEHLFGSLNGLPSDEDDGECFDFWAYAMNVLDRIEARQKLSLHVGVSEEGSFEIKVYPFDLGGDADDD